MCRTSGLALLWAAEVQGAVNLRPSAAALCGGLKLPASSTQATASTLQGPESDKRRPRNY